MVRYTEPCARYAEPCARLTYNKLRSEKSGWPPPPLYCTHAPRSRCAIFFWGTIITVLFFLCKPKVSATWWTDSRPWYKTQNNLARKTKKFRWFWLKEPPVIRRTFLGRKIILLSLHTRLVAFWPDVGSRWSVWWSVKSVRTCKSSTWRWCMTARARVESTVGTKRLWKSTSAGTLGYSQAGTTQASQAMVSRFTEKSKIVDAPPTTEFAPGGFVYSMNTRASVCVYLQFRLLVFTLSCRALNLIQLLSKPWSKVSSTFSLLGVFPPILSRRGFSILDARRFWPSFC